MNPVFLDTVGLIAVWDKADQWHGDAEPVFRELVASGRPILTTTLVLYECGNAAARRPYRIAVHDLRSWLTAKDCLIEPTVSDLDTAWSEYRERQALARPALSITFRSWSCAGLASTTPSPMTSTSRLPDSPRCSEETQASQATSAQ